ncbi:cyclodeaminase [Pseudogracilibacillus sp. SO30301A]|uniref:cyclodeaminase n=1 Tax=Pseudogracilibacillus sp. SO30301A TaxID=3098291 RepID=UPI00300E01F6
MKIFTEEEIRENIKIDTTVIQEIKSAFTDLYTKNVQMPPIMRVDIPENKAEVDVKTAYIPGYKSFALKVSSGFFNNYKYGLPSTGGLMFLISAINGQPEALLYDNGYLTDVRTAAAGAVAADYLANETIDVVGVIGAGAQARYQVEALRFVRDFQHVHIYSKTKKRVLEFKQEMEEKLDIIVSVKDSPEEVARGSDLIITTTPAEEPVLQREWIQPGTHITAMGADAPYKQELDPKILQMADFVVCDVIDQCEVCGELKHAIEANLMDKKNVFELGQLTSQKQKLRDRDDAITVTDLTGTGVQDTKIALYVYKKLIETVESNNK